MADIEDTHFETGDSGASTTYPMQCSALRKNGFVMLKVCLLSISQDVIPSVGLNGDPQNTVHPITLVFQCSGHPSLLFSVES